MLGPFAELTNNFERYVSGQLNPRVDPSETGPQKLPGDRRHVAAMPAEAVISRSLGANFSGTNDMLTWHMQELNGISDEHVKTDLRSADRRKGYWLDEDPSLDRMLQWIRMQR
jgi:hypothetical protein